MKNLRISTKTNKVYSGMDINRYHNSNSKRIFKGLIVIFLCIHVFTSIEVRAQATFPFIQRKTWDGPFDIKMIAAPNLEAVYLNDAKATAKQLLADSVIRQKTFTMSGNLMEINNRFKGGNPFVQLDIPLPALMCPDPNAACYLGLGPSTLDDPTKPPKCPNGGKYGTVPTVTKWVSMSYSDYDNDNSTFSSSMAFLDIAKCAEIEAAYLYWTGNFQTSNPAIKLLDGPVNSYTGSADVFNTGNAAAPGGATGYQNVKLKLPGGTYKVVTATAAASGVRNSPGSYLCVADVTTMVKGSGGGQFWVADLQSYPNEGDGGSCSGWVLVVVFKSPLSPPRLISLWDGFKSISSNSSEVFTLTGLQAPATTNFKSYVGFAALDGENLATQIKDVKPEGLGFKTSGSAQFNINPFETDQPPYKLWYKGGSPAMDKDLTKNLDPTCKGPIFDGTWVSGYDGISSSHITSYSEVTGKNGNEIVRLPSNTNTLGFDAHHMILPDGAVSPGATSATITVNAGPQGSTTPFMAYVAIEKLQPKLVLTKFVDKDQTNTGGKLKYTLKIKNLGNQDSYPNTDFILDTLDPVTTYTANSIKSTVYTKSVASVGTVAAPGITTFGTPQQQILKFNLAKSIPQKDSLFIDFEVDVLQTGTPTADLLYTTQCKRTILNTAWIDYQKNSIPERLKSKSNSGECNDGSEVKVKILVPGIPPNDLGTVDASSFSTDFIVKNVRKQIALKVPASAADTANFLIYDASGNRVFSFETFPSGAGSLVYMGYRDITTGGCQEIIKITFTFCTVPPKPVVAAIAPKCAGSTFTLTGPTSPAPVGKLFWYSSATGGLPQPDPYTTPQLNATTKYYLIDSVLATKCKSLRTEVTVTIDPVPANPTAKAVNPICASNTVKLEANGTATGTFFWYAAATGGTPNANPYTTPSLSTTTDYYLIDSSTTTSTHCKSIRTKVTVVVNPVPANPTAPAALSICPGTTAVLDKKDVAATGKYFWYTKAAGGVPNANPFTTAVLNAATTFYLIDSISATGCKSLRTPFTVTVSAVPAKPAFAGPSICPNNSKVLDKNDVAATGAYFWYTKATGGTPATNPFTTPVLSANTTYYLIDSIPSIGGCKSARTAVTVLMNPVPGKPAYPTVQICTNDPVTLDKKDVAATGTYFWYTSSTGGTANANPFVISSLSATTTYYLIDSNTTTGCRSPRTAVLVQVNPIPTKPAAPIIAGICAGASAKFETTDIPTGKFFWYTKATGGAPNANPYSASLNVTTTYYLIDSVPSGCKSPRTAVTVNVDPAVVAGTINTVPGMCSGTKFTLTQNTPATGGNNTYTYSWLSDDGTGFKAIAGTDAIDYTALSGVPITTKFKRVVTSGTCKSEESNTVTVTILPGLNPGEIKRDSTICFNTKLLITNKTTYSGGNGTFAVQWDSSPDGLSWTPIPGAITDDYQTPNLTSTTYFQRNVISGTGSCSKSTSNIVKVTVNPELTSAGTISTDKATVCSKDSVDISGTSPVGGTGSYTYAWDIDPKIPIRANTNSTFPDMMLTASSKTLYTITRTATSGTCGSLSTTVNVTVNPRVDFEVELDPIADICSTDPNPVNFTATPKPATIGAGTYEWIVSNPTQIQTSTTNTLNLLPATLVNGQTVFVKLKPAADACPLNPVVNSNTLTLKVASKVIPSVTLKNIIPDCEGKLDTLVATINGAGVNPPISWTINGLTDPNTNDTLIYAPKNNDVVKVTVISNSNCKSSVPGEDQATASLTLTVKPLVTPAITIEADNYTPCSGDPVTFTIKSQNDGGTFPTYKWYSTKLGVQTHASALPFVTTKLTGTDDVWVEMTSNAECIVAGKAVAKSNLETVTVTPRVTPKTSIFASPNGTICTGEEVTFKASNIPTDTANGGSAVAYEWRVNGDLLGSGPTFQSKTLSNNNVVEVTYISSLRCLVNNDKTATATIVMKVNNPKVSIDAKNIFCDNDRAGVFTALPVDATDLVTGTGPTYTWQVFGATPANGTGQTYPRATLADGDKVVVTMKPGYTCNGSPIKDSVIVTVYAKPAISVDWGIPVICPGDQTTFTASGGPVSKYTWTRGTTNLNNDNPSLIAGEAGNYVVRATNVLDNCFTEASHFLSVEYMLVDAGPDRSMYKGEFAILLGSINGKYDIAWTPAESVSDATTLSPIVTPSETTLYKITATSANNCTKSDEVLVRVFVPLDIPNAFTPNGDGLNDGWVIKGMEKYPNSKVKIFNRWGGIIHEDKNGYQYPWDGTNNGQLMPTGTYYYVIDLIGSPDNTDKSVSGYLVLIR